MKKMGAAIAFRIKDEDKRELRLEEGGN